MIDQNRKTTPDPFSPPCKQSHATVPCKNTRFGLYNAGGAQFTKWAFTTHHQMWVNVSGPYIHGCIARGDYTAGQRLDDHDLR